MVRKDVEISEENPVVTEKSLVTVKSVCSCKIGRDIYCKEHGDPDKK